MSKEEIRAILVGAHAPDCDIEWLVESCPSVAAARTYRAPAPMNVTFCLRCRGNRQCDAHGCVVCAQEMPR